MAKKSPPVLWLSYLGQTEYENLNPFWAFCEAGGDPPDRVALLHASASKADMERVAERFTMLSEQYLKRPPAIDTIAFDDEDVGEFREKSEAVFQAAAVEKAELIVDVSPTSWSYVPVYLMKLVGTHRSRVRSVVYFQYAEPGMRRTPYPLIPRRGIIRHDLLSVFSDGKEAPR